jgi:hypothetical protein
MSRYANDKSQIANRKSGSERWANEQRLDCWWIHHGKILKPRRCGKKSGLGPRSPSMVNSTIANSFAICDLRFVIREARHSRNDLADGGTRTRTALSGQRILSPLHVLSYSRSVVACVKICVRNCTRATTETLLAASSTAEKQTGAHCRLDG